MTERKSDKDRNIESIDFVFKLAIPIDLDRYPEIEFARAHKKERNSKSPKSPKTPSRTGHNFHLLLGTLLLFLFLGSNEVLT